jgi:biphenyl-2,3-diol 1,2-dioxygenase
MSIKSLGYIGFSVSDVSEWRNFLSNKIGLMEVDGDEDSARYRMDCRSWRISVEKGSDDDISFAGYEVADPESLKEITERLIKDGIDVTIGDEKLAKKRNVMELISFKDPFGMSLEIYYGATEVYQLPFVSSTGVTGFRTGEQGAGHYFYVVSNIEKALDFYTKTMGFKMSDVIDIAMGPDLTVRGYFLHCNGRHHTLAIAEAPIPKKIHHFLLQANTIDDVGHACDRLDAIDTNIDSNLGTAEGNVESCLTTTLGRHVNDHMLSFYAVTPSGFEVEFGWGPRDIDHESWVMTHHNRTAMWGHKSLRK